ncbi:hypothetical protein MPER_14172, partial [Moniliophthora perniciosa FA553]
LTIYTTDKEIWEPILDNLLRSCQFIREAWAFDCHTHGESAILNEKALASHQKPIGSDHWAQALAEFVQSDHVRGHNLVLIGHSFGTIAAMYSTKFFVEKERPPYAGIILVESPLIDREVFYANFQQRIGHTEAVV